MNVSVYVLRTLQCDSGRRRRLAPPAPPPPPPPRPPPPHPPPPRPRRLAPPAIHTIYQQRPPPSNIAYHIASQAFLASQDTLEVWQSVSQSGSESIGFTEVTLVTHQW